MVVKITIIVFIVLIVTTIIFFKMIVIIIIFFRLIETIIIIRIIIKIIKINDRSINDKSYKIILIIIVLMVITADVKGIMRVIRNGSIILIIVRGDLIIKIIIVLNSDDRLNRDDILRIIF